MQNSTAGFLSLILLVASASVGTAATLLFEEDFEGGGLGQWTGKNGGAYSGQIVVDPLNAANQVVNFTAVIGAGDIYTTSTIDVGSASHPVLLSFDYLGLPGQSSPVDDLGGFIGISLSLNPTVHGGDHFWLAGTRPVDIFSGLGYVGPELVDDGQWHHYEIDLSLLISNAGLGDVRLMLEDYDGSSLVAGDAYFDNVELEVVPEPTTALLLLLGLTGLLFTRLLWRRIVGPSAPGKTA